MRLWVACSVLLLLRLSCAALPSSSTITCDGNVTLPIARVDDDYCDCDDLSDEPHTSACASFNASAAATASFLCANVGFLPRNISSAFVHDTICDCCDGSDERTASAASSSSCPNTCQQQAQSWLEEQQSFLASYKLGVSARTGLLPHIAAAQQYYRGEHDWLVGQLHSTYYPQLTATRAKHDAVSEDDKSPARQQLEQRLQALQQHVQMLEARLGLVGGVLGLREDVRLETEEEAAERTRQQLQREKQENREKRDRGEKVRKKSPQQLAQQEAASKPQQTRVQRRVPSAILSDIFLALFPICVSTDWEQRLYGERGVVIDQYRITLCPLQNATQVKLDGEDYKAVVLGHWEGVVRTAEMLSVQSRIDVQRREQQRLHYIAQLIQQQQPPGLNITAYMQHLSFLFTLAHQAEQTDQRLHADMQMAAQQLVRPASASSVLLLDRPEYYMRYLGGEACFEVGEREVVVRLVCGRTNGELRDVRENGKCKYEMTLETSAACETKWHRDASKQLDDLRAHWQHHWAQHGRASGHRDEL